MEPDCGDGGLNDNLSEIADKQVHRVQKEQILRHGGIAINGVKNGRHIHQQLGKHRPQVLNIPEEDKHGREDKPYPDVKQDQHTNGVEQADELPGEWNAVDHAEHKKHAQRQAKVNESLDIFGEEEQVLWHIDLREDLGVAHEGSHTLAGGLVEVGKY